MARIWVAMSGGVDSSVAAALLVEQGHEVTGVTMQLWPSGDDVGGCCSVAAINDARRVCAKLDIPHYVLNYRELFEIEVVRPFTEAYARGITPNPCIVCNDRIKFADLLAKVSLQGAEALATGHYARVVRDSSGCRWLARGVDSEKDQSYFLYNLTPTQLDHVVFPVGELTKSQVRKVAEEYELPVAAKQESQDICFVPQGGLQEFLFAVCPESLRSGDIVSVSGEVLGQHDGVANFTVGQRKGIGVGGFAEPLYVIAVDAVANRIVVGTRDQLAVREVEASQVTWRDDAGECLAMVRYRMEPRAALVRLDAGTLRVSFTEPLHGVAPGQSVVCYRDDIVLGGGVITCAR